MCTCVVCVSVCDVHVHVCTCVYMFSMCSGAFLCVMCLRMRVHTCVPAYPCVSIRVHECGGMSAPSSFHTDESTEHTLGEESVQPRSGGWGPHWPVTAGRRSAAEGQNRPHRRGEGRKMPPALTIVSHGRRPLEHLLPMSFGMKLPHSAPKRQF